MSYKKTAPEIIIGARSRRGDISGSRAAACYLDATGHRAAGPVPVETHTGSHVRMAAHKALHRSDETVRPPLARTTTTPNMQVGETPNSGYVAKLPELVAVNIPYLSACLGYLQHANLTRYNALS
jgi:hypothetical protein